MSAVSVPFVVKRTSNGYISEMLDTDEDNLADVYEQKLGTDISDADTDDDTLTDYEEVYKTNTDPLKYDSVKDGISDSESDGDEDGLSAREELDLGTNCAKPDTDGDTLTDGDEVNKYHTDPLVSDTDGDGLSDGDEVMFGEDPLDEDSDDNGIPDGQEKRTQTFTHEAENKDCAVTEVTVTMDATGNINNTTEIESIMDKDYMCSRVVGLVGEPFSIETTSEFTEATLTFKVDQTKLGDTEFDNLMFLWYDEENDNFVELETEHDVGASTVSITTTHFSKYLIVDSKTWFNTWAEIAQKIEAANSEEYESLPTATGVIIKCSDENDPVLNYNVLNMDGSYKPVNSRLRHLIRDSLVDSMSDDDLMSFSYTEDLGSPTGQPNLYYVHTDLTNSKSWLKNWDEQSYCYKNDIGFDSALLSRHLCKNAPGYNYRLVVITDSDVTFDYFNNYQSFYVYIDQYNIPLYFFCVGDFDHPNIDALVERCGGDVFQFVVSDEAVSIPKAICYMEQVEREKASRKPDNTPHHSDEDEFYDEQETAGLIYNSCGERVYTDFLNGDTDDDGLLDSEEVSVFESFEDVQLENQYYYGRKYFHQMYSDPNNPDTDYDGISDGIDNDSISSDSNTFFGELTTYYKDDLSESIKIDVDYRFDMRYFFKDRSKYNRDLSTISILASSIIYKNNILEVDDNQYYAYTWLKHHGFKDIKDYEIAEGSEEFNIDGYNDNDISQIHIGHQLVTYNGETKDIIAIVVRGTNGTIEEWTSNMDLGCTSERDSYMIYKDSGDVSRFDYPLKYIYENRYNEFCSFDDWKTENNHKGFDVATNRIIRYISAYSQKYVDSDKAAFWIAGHSRGGAIANILSAYLIEQDNEVYGYTFAAPNTTTDQDYNDDKYKSIYNIVNFDDFVPELPTSHWKFNKYGVTIGESVSEYANELGGYKYDSTLSDTIIKISNLANDRNECYTKYNKTTRLTEPDVSDNARPYIKYKKNTCDYTVIEPPIFYFQLLAAVMAEVNGSKVDFINELNSYDYTFVTFSLGIAKMHGIEHPHYLQSYYVLSKNI